MVSTRPPDALVTGLNIVDILVRLPETVVQGEKHQVRDLVIQGGGPAGNAASLLASLGWRTGFLARVGADSMSGIARAELTRHGVVEDYFIPDAAARPGVGLVEIDPATGERTVFYTLAGYRSLTAGDIPRDDIAGAKLILADTYEAATTLAMLEAARGTDCRSVLDVEAGAPEILREIIALGTDVILPLGAARRLTGEGEPAAALRSLAAWTRGQLLVTDGCNGSWALAGNEILHQPVFPVATLDTTGCGDAYHGAYASALLAGWPLPLRMEFAAWAAARVATVIGGRGNLPTRATVRDAAGGFSPPLQKAITDWK